MRNSPYLVPKDAATYPVRHIYLPFNDEQNVEMRYYPSPRSGYMVVTVRITDYTSMRGCGWVHAELSYPSPSRSQKREMIKTVISAYQNALNWRKDA